MNYLLGFTRRITKRVLLLLAVMAVVFILMPSVSAEETQAATETVTSESSDVQGDGEFIIIPDEPIPGASVQTGQTDANSIQQDETTQVETAQGKDTVTGKDAVQDGASQGMTGTEKAEQETKAPEKLPQTGGVPPELLGALGSIMAGIGILLNNRSKNTQK